MNKILYPRKEDWAKVLERPVNKGEDLEKVCRAVFDEVARDGDEALRKYTWYFDRVKLGDFEVSEEEFEQAEREVRADLKEAICLAKENIERFHEAQVPGVCEYVNEKGFRCWQEARAIDRVDCTCRAECPVVFDRVDAGCAARIAGCRDVVV